MSIPVIIPTNRVKPNKSLGETTKNRIAESIKQINTATTAVMIIRVLSFMILNIYDLRY